MVIQLEADVLICTEDFRAGSTRGIRIQESNIKQALRY